MKNFLKIHKIVNIIPIKPIIIAIFKKLTLKAQINGLIHCITESDLQINSKLKLTVTKDIFNVDL